MSLLIVFRRLQIHYYNIVYYMVLPLLSCSISKDLSLHYYDITNSYESDHHLLYPAFFVLLEKALM